MSKYTIEDVEKAVLDSYVAQGFKVGEGNWGFRVHVSGYYKDKSIQVTFFDGVKASYVYSSKGKTFKKLFKSAIEFFKGETKETVKNTLETPRPEYLSH